MQMTKKKLDDKDFLNKHRTEWQAFLWKRFIEKLTTTKTIKETNKIVGSLFSAYEKELLTKRIAVLALLKSGKGVREISRILWIAPQTIGALKKSYFNSPKIYRSQRFFKSLIKPPLSKSPAVTGKKDWLDEFFGGIDIFELFKNPPRPVGMGIKNHRL
jgi:Trp operon repressor